MNNEGGGVQVGCALFEWEGGRKEGGGREGGRWRGELIPKIPHYYKSKV